MTNTVAIWVFIAFVGIVGFFLVRFLHQLTKVAVQSENTFKELNTRLPGILDYSERVLAKADDTVDRVNLTLSEIEAPIHYVRMFTHLLQESRKYLGTKAGKGVLAFFTGFKVLRAIITGMKERFSSTGEHPVENSECQ